jgi:hypothetical protein
MTDFEGQVLADLSVLKSQMREILVSGSQAASRNWKAVCMSTRRSCNG